MKNYSISVEWYNEIKALVPMENPYFITEDNLAGYVEVDILDEKLFERISIKLGWMKDEYAMSLEKALAKYMENIMEKVENHSMALDGLFECHSCPFAERCRESAEHDDDIRCGEFIKNMLTDGSLYKA